MGWRGGGEGAAAPQIFVNVNLIPVDNDSEKKKVAKKYKPFQIPQKLLVTLLLSTSCNAIFYHHDHPIKKKIFHKTMPFSLGL